MQFDRYEASHQVPAPQPQLMTTETVSRSSSWLQLITESHQEQEKGAVKQKWTELIMYLKEPLLTLDETLSSEEQGAFILTWWKVWVFKDWIILSTDSTIGPKLLTGQCPPLPHPPSNCPQLPDHARLICTMRAHILQCWPNRHQTPSLPSTWGLQHNSDRESPLQMQVSFLKNFWRSAACCTETSLGQWLPQASNQTEWIL